MLHRLFFSLVFGCLLASAATPAQETGPSAQAEQLIKQERIRSAVEQALETIHQPNDSGAEELDIFVSTAHALAELGPGVVTYLENEISQASPDSFFLCAFTLGQLKTPEAEAVLRAASERAERDFGDFAVVRKAWVAFALGLMGKADALDLVNTGRHKAGHYSIHSSTSVMESIAIQTYPESVPVLTAQLDRYAGDDAELTFQRTYTLRALGRVADPSTTQRLIRVLGEPNGLMRYEAARALGNIGGPEAADGLVAALGDEDTRVRKGAAAALEMIAPAQHLGAFVARLKTEDSAIVRGSLYALVARLGGTDALPVLREHWGRADGLDRMYLVSALHHIGTDATLDMLRSGFGDADSRVVARSVRSATAVGTPAARKLLSDAIRSTSWPLVQMTVESLAGGTDRAVAALIADRLLQVEVAGVVTNPGRRSPIELLSKTLIALNHDAHLDQLREATARQTDPTLVQMLEGHLVQLELMRKNGDNGARWIEALASTEPGVRSLARKRLADLGGKKAARALAESFGRIPAGEGLEVLEALGSIDASPARQLLRRVLVSPDFDPAPRWDLRDMAAWSARRIGGPEMIAALREAVERREGRDARVMVYLALAEGKSASPILARYRAPRMRYLKWTRGREQEKLDWIARELSAGRSIDSVDLEPIKLVFR